MTGSAYGIEVICVGVLACLMWALRTARGRVRVAPLMLVAQAAVALWLLACIVIIPIVAKPGNQTGWTDFVIGAVAFAVAAGTHDVILVRREQRRP